jgi:hypothetical protein
MEQFFDGFSKNLARVVSRRDLVRITSRTFIGAFFASSGIGKLWASTSGWINMRSVKLGTRHPTQCDTAPSEGDDCECAPGQTF